jgi:HAD superfamily hydrolase (TIGR01509 family)
VTAPLPAPPWAALFDWDGVVIDSSAHHEQSWERLAAEEGHALPAGHFQAGFGRKNEFIIPHLLGWTHDPAEIHRLSRRKEELYRVIVTERGLVPLDGTRAWLATLAAAGIPCVIGSSTHRENIELGLKSAGLAEFFRDFVTSEDVSHGKPDPEVFLKAAAKAGLPPERCVVFEDALVGIEAARRGGMRVVAVATTHPLEELRHADLAVTRLDQLRVETLTSWFAPADA